MKVNKKKDLIETRKKVLFLSITFVFMFMIILIPLVNKGTYSDDTNLESNDGLTLSCVDTALSEEVVECNISLNSVSMITQGLTLKYSLPEGVTYVDFSTDAFETYSNDKDGIVLVNLEGVSGENVSVGKLKLKMPTDALPNSIHKIELVEVTIGDGNDTVVELENAFDEIRIKSDINTLEGITLSDGTINETFNKDVLEYTATTYSDKITINVSKTDDKSTVSGDVGVEKALHYGTNKLNIVVTSEDGTEKTYKINIFRTYKFITDKYVYNEIDNYIYVGTDIDNLLKNISVDNRLEKNIEDDVLVISYEEESILEIDILSINFNKYELINKTLYVDEVLPEEEFALKVDASEGITFDLSESGKVSVLYNDVSLDSYDLVVYSLEFDNSLTVDYDNLYIKKLVLGTIVSELLNDVSVTGGIIGVYDKNGIKKESDSMIVTGDELRVYLGDSLMDKYQLSVLSDSNGDGRLSTIDLARIRKHLVEFVNEDGSIFELKGVYKESLDLNKDGRVSVADLSLMRKRLVG